MSPPLPHREPTDAIRCSVREHGLDIIRNNRVLRFPKANDLQLLLCSCSRGDFALLVIRLLYRYPAATHTLYVSNMAIWIIDVHDGDAAGFGFLCVDNGLFLPNVGKSMRERRDSGTPNPQNAVTNVARRGFKNLRTFFRGVDSLLQT